MNNNTEMKNLGQSDCESSEEEKLKRNLTENFCKEDWNIKQQLMEK